MPETALNFSMENTDRKTETSGPNETLGRASFWSNSDIRIWTAFGFAKFLIHILTWNAYGIFRDEFYFIACGRHLDWGYVDHAPMIGWLARLADILPGPAMFGLRLLPALAGGIKVMLVGWMTRELGGNRFAQCLAMLAFITAVVFLGADSMLSIVSFEQLFWIMCTCALVRILKDGNEKDWLWFGLFSGLALLTKHSVLIFGFSVTCALVLTPARKFFKSAWLYTGGIVALLLFLPNIIWQVVHDWPTVSFLRVLNQYVHSGIAPLEFMIGQVLYLTPFTLPLWLIGLIYFFTPSGRQFRVLGWTYIFTMAILILLRSKIYYSSPVYPPLFAAGATVLEGWLEQGRLRMLRPVAVAFLVIGGCLFAPIGVPCLPIETYRSYIGAFTRVVPNSQELRDLFADRFGWENQVKTAAGVYHSLTPEEKSRCKIFTGNYGEAAAVDFFGPDYDLPPALCGHLTYHFWGPGEPGIDMLIVYGIGIKKDGLLEVFNDVQPAAQIQHPYCALYENNLTVYVCRNPKQALAGLWPTLRNGF